MGRRFRSRARNHLPANSPLCHEPTSSGRAARCQFTSPALPGKRANPKSATRYARGSEGTSNRDRHQGIENLVVQHGASFVTPNAASVRKAEAGAATEPPRAGSVTAPVRATKRGPKPTIPGSPTHTGSTPHSSGSSTSTSAPSSSSTGSRRSSTDTSNRLRAGKEDLGPGHDHGAHWSRPADAHRRRVAPRRFWTTSVPDHPMRLARGSNCKYERARDERYRRKFLHACARETPHCLSSLLSLQTAPLQGGFFTDLLQIDCTCPRLTSAT